MTHNNGHCPTGGENRRIRMKNLERQKACAMCTAAFPTHDPDAIMSHYKEHANAIAATGKCPICATEGWVFMDMDHKKKHIYDHFDEIESTRIKDFWAEISCPVCLEDLHLLDPRKVLDHIAGHTPGIVRYCNICSLDTQTATRTERTHHDQTCRSFEFGEDPDINPNFCGQCGRIRAMNETDEQRKEHGKICRSIMHENCKEVRVGSYEYRRCRI